VEEPLATPENALRLRALVPLTLGFLALVVLCASDAHWSLSVPLGLVSTLVAAFGALDLIGSFDDATPAQELPRARLRARLFELLLACLFWVGSLRLAVAGALPHHAVLAPLLVGGASVTGLLALARVALLGVAGGTRLRERPGFWLGLSGVVTYVPLAGSYSLLDPWETHYGEVAREMLARDDWLSFWWAQEGWFWSKPALSFWLQGLCFSLFGVKFAPGEVLSDAALGRLPQPEWAARLPVLLLTLIAIYAVYRFISAAVGKRAGFLAGLVLSCSPYWSLLAHQSMTDMPYVAPLTTALSLFGLALLADPEELVPSFAFTLRGRSFKLSAFHALFGLVLLSALPQLSYLVSRNLTLQLVAPPYGFRWHWDELFSGSGLGNCGLPGNEACRRAVPSNPFFQPLLGATIWAAALGYLLHLNRGERRKKRLLYVAAWFFTALAALAKGAPGLVLPLAIAATVLVTRRQWAELPHVELGSLGLVFAAVCLPWYVQEYMRHGEAFTDRLLFHDMYKRAFVHVHDTNSGTDVSLRYYIWQLGYGAFPLTGLAPLGVAWALERGSEHDPRARDASLVTALWLTLSFALFTLSLTKFHHYALPCAPPLAIATGLLLARALGDRRLPTGWRLPAYLSSFGAAALLLIAGAARLPATPVSGALCLALGAALVLGAVLICATGEPSTPDPGLAVLGLIAAGLVLLVARDLSTTIGSDVPASARLLHLFTYNYKRSWPAALDFEPQLWAFGVVAAAASVLLAVPRIRLHAVTLTCAVALWFCAFSLWIYLPALAPHFGQRELILAYYQQRASTREPLVAYQMNWKGENFYTGNRLPAFVTTGAKFTSWLSTQRKRGVKVMYFVLEHARIGALKSELGSGYSLRSSTNKQLNNKFVLVRVEHTGLPSELQDATD
jgi:4-amino-4-deoxy-L-arabinose transferase-like glycosyltransferase